MTKQTQKALFFGGVFIVLLGTLKHVAGTFVGGADVAFAVAFLFQVFVPVWTIERNGERLQDYKIWIPRANERIDSTALWSDLRRVLIGSLATLPAFAIAYYGLQVFLANQNGMQANFKFDVSDNFAAFALSTLVVAVAEEIFYRGYIQTTLLKEWSLPAAFFVTNLIFALGHFAGEYQIGRLLPFFPGLLFSYLVFRSRSIVGAIVFHAFCNIYAELLRASFYWSV